MIYSAFADTYCANCGGTGMVGRNQCKACNGSGRVPMGIRRS